MVISFPQEVQEVLSQLEKAGFTGYAVGGAVRDTLLGRKPEDWDLCTDARPEEIRRVFDGFPVILTGELHGTVTVIWKGRPYEITTYRREMGYSDGRHPDQVAFVPTLEEDLARRDFTINAMACRPGEEVVDLFGGRQDLEQGTVRAVGDSGERFREDALRILRAVRFASVYNFAVEEKTAQSAEQLAPLLKRVSKERIAGEWRKLLAGPGAGRLLGEFPQVASAVLPQVLDNDTKAPAFWKKWGRELDRLPPDPIIRMGALFCRRELDKKERVQRAEEGAESLRLSRGEQRALVQLVDYSGRPFPTERKEWFRWRQALGREGMEQLLTIVCWESRSHEEQLEREEQGEAYRMADDRCPCIGREGLAVTGRDLLDLGYAPGPGLGQELDRLLELVWEEKAPNQKECLLAESWKRRLAGEKKAPWRQ